MQTIGFVVFVQTIEGIIFYKEKQKTFYLLVFPTVNGVIRSKNKDEAGENAQPEAQGHQQPQQEFQRNG
jgi:hypothetical protein